MKFVISNADVLSKFVKNVILNPKNLAKDVLDVEEIYKKIIYMYLFLIH